MYQDEAGFGRISKLGSCWAPIGVGPHVHSHYIREFCYCYGAVDAHTGESFFLIAGGCHTEWMNAFLEELSQAYSDDYLLLVMDNAIWHNKSAESVNQALKLILKQDKILSITADNGTEFNRLSDVFSEEHIYYAHPYASWERGTDENHNRLIRRWLPKGTKKTTPKEVAFIENWINNYPKKCLNYKSPREDFFMANLNLNFGFFEKIGKKFKNSKKTLDKSCKYLYNLW